MVACEVKHAEVKPNREERERRELVGITVHGPWEKMGPKGGRGGAAASAKEGKIGGNYELNLRVGIYMN
jgi:predicted NUDIX family NTP pyrophosphohydrolase